jgi:formylglycine-generating enzyme required for sulfatase activity
LQRTTVVGIFEEGENDAGVSDMSGNVWEWPNTKYGSKRIYRGGSWISTANGCQVAISINYSPDYRYNDIGFRVAQSL